MDARAAELIEQLRLEPHPEGGFYRQVFKSARPVLPDRSALTAIYFLLPEGGISRWHRVTSDELWTHLEGSPLLLRTFDGTSVRVQRLTPSSIGDAPANEWQCAETEGGYALVACFVAPGFEFEDFSLLEDEETKARIADIDASLSRFT
jgi:predicted cupin superfamily sugar epimerase